MSLTQYAKPSEARIARKIVADALEKGWTISVWDGEEWTVKRSSDSDRIIGALCSTDSDALRFRDGDTIIGSVSLVWGNDEDVISDHTDCPELNEFMEGRY